MKFEGFEKNTYTVCNGCLSHLRSISFNQYFCLMCIYQLFLMLGHTKSYVEKTLKITGHQCGAHGHQVARKDQPGCPQA